VAPDVDTGRPHFEVGTKLDPWTDAPLSISDFVRYQGASGDMNPIHHDSSFAESAGFPGPFAVGMLTAGIAASYVTSSFGPESIRRFRVRWRELGWPGDVMTYAGTVTDIRQGSERPELEVVVTVTRQNGEPHLTAWAAVVAPSDEDV
jgi:acyl dehydratase